jgi:AcrR family transcriptional regulator
MRSTKTVKNKPNSRKIQMEERRLQILDTAIPVFAERGFTKTTVKDIADAAGISNGLMYHYFPSKEKLLEAAVERHSFLPQLRKALIGTENPCREVLKDIAIRFVGLLNQEDDIIRIFLQEGYTNTRVQKIWSNLSHGGVALLQEYIASRITAGELKPHNVEVTARCLFSIIFMFHFTNDIFKSSGLNETDFVEAAIDNLLQGIQKDGC